MFLSINGFLEHIRTFKKCSQLCLQSLLSFTKKQSVFKSKKKVLKSYKVNSAFVDSRCRIVANCEG